MSRMKRSKWKKTALVVLGGGMLFQAGCPTIFAPVLLSLAESGILTLLLGRGF